MADRGPSTTASTGGAWFGASVLSLGLVVWGEVVRLLVSSNGSKGFSLNFVLFEFLGLVGGSMRRFGGGEGSPSGKRV